MTQKIVGIGDAGCAFVTRLNYLKNKKDSYHTIALNTVWHPYDLVHADEHHHLKIQDGGSTKGNPMIGRQVAEDHKDLFFELLAGAEQVVVTAGMGGGTGTGASHVIAYVARELRIPTIAVVTTPFTFEGIQRQRLSDLGIKALEKFTDEVIQVRGDREVTKPPMDQSFSGAEHRYSIADYYSAMQYHVSLQVRHHLKNSSVG